MFKAPERNRVTALTARFWGFPQEKATNSSYGNNGVFYVPPTKNNRGLIIICSDGGGWEHISVRAWSRKGGEAMPNWTEMCVAKHLFWAKEDACVQYHPRASEYVTAHPFVLHIWRPVDGVLPEPPAWMVGNKPGQTKEEAMAEGDRALQEAS